MAISEIDDLVPITKPIPIPIPTPIPTPTPIPIPFSMAWYGRAAHGALLSGNFLQLSDYCLPIERKAFLQKVEKRKNKLSSAGDQPCMIELSLRLG